MSATVQHRRGARTDAEAATPAAGELWFDTTLKAPRMGDGAQLGGFLSKLWGKSYTVAPAQITSNQNNYNPTDLAIAETLVLDLDADRSVTGLAGGAAGVTKWVYNSSAFRLTLPHESGSSTAANRFSHLNGADMVLRPGQGCRLQYIAGSFNRWVITGRMDLSVTTLAEAVFLTGECRPAQVTANQNDWDPTDAGSSLAWSASRHSVIVFDTDAGRNFTGLAGGAKGRIAILHNKGSNNAVLQKANASSSAANRFDFSDDVTIGSKQSAILWYDSTASRWKLLAGPAAASSGGAAADLEITLGELALQIADNTNAALFLGSAGNRFADSFDALSYVDTAGATNLDSGTAGVLKPTSSTSTTGTFGQTQTGGAAILLVGGNDHHAGLKFTAPASGSITQVRITATAVTASGSWEARLYTNNSGSPGTQVGASSNAVSISATGDKTFTFATPPSITSGTVYWLVITPTTGIPDFSIAYCANQASYGSGIAADITSITDTGVGGGNEIRMEITYQSGFNNLTVASTSLTAAAAPSSVKIIARVKEIDSITLNTDLLFDVSRDGGTTWTTATMTDRFTSASPTASIHILESNSIDITSQPTGTSVKWRCRTDNNKSIELHDLYIYWT